jgi:fatty-acyl-CoA synthase
MILYTSGTTGKPKGVVLSHANVMWNAVNTLVDTDITTDEVTLVVAPLFHAAGLNMTCLPTLLKGGRVVLVPSFDAGEVLGLLESHGVTHMFGVPGMFDAMAAHPRWHQTDLSGVRLFNCGGAPVPQRTLRAYLDRGLPMGQGYGLTEAAPGVLLLNEAMAAAKPGSAGLPHFFTDVRVARADGSDTGPGERGEILVSGPNVMAGYWQDPAATDAAFTSDGWLRTGDVAVLDPDGAAAVVDRVKDMYVSGGENVYPAEVEDVLLDHPAVAQCAVIGVADERWGEVGRAFVVAEPGADPGADCLLRYLRERLAGYKVPRTVVFRPDLPRTASGKVAKNALRDAGTPA